jgi:hypothetical protein
MEELTKRVCDICSNKQDKWPTPWTDETYIELNFSCTDTGQAFSLQVCPECLNDAGLRPYCDSDSVQKGLKRNLGGRGGYDLCGVAGLFRHYEAWQEKQR